MADQYGFLHPGPVEHPRQRISVVAGIRPRRRKHRAFAITGHIPGQHAVAGKRHLFMPGGRAGTDAVQQRQRRTASLFTKTRHHRSLATLHFRQRMIFRVGRNMRFWRTEHHAHQRLFLAVVEQSAIDSGRNGNQIAFAQDGLGIAVAIWIIRVICPLSMKNTSSTSSCRCSGPSHLDGNTMVEKVKCSA